MSRRLRLLVDLVLYWDFGVGVVAGLAVFLVARVNSELRDDGIGFLIAEGSLAVALLAVVLTALSILVAFLSEDYVLMLRRTEDGIEGALRPYKTVGVLSGTTSLIALLGALAWVASSPTAQAVILGLSSGLLVWTVAATVDLVLKTAWHGTMRSRLPEIREAGRQAVEKRRKSDPRSA